MGKWTPSYTDDVLHAKISNLVSGSIRRAAVEKEPCITYENFVNDLDTGDSFTTTLIDILVKEIADRRTRTTDSDRKFIGERTVRGLRSLANTSRNRPYHPFRRNAVDTRNTMEYFTTSPHEMDMDDDDDDFEIMADNPTIIEGVRINSDLYDAYASSGWSPSLRRINTSPPSAEEWTAMNPASTFVARPYASSSSVGSAVPTYNSMNMARQASIRRPRSRVVDFHEYTHRRRSHVREALAGSRPDAPESVTEPRDAHPATVRRFFPFSRQRRQAQAQASMMNPPWPEFSDTTSPDSEDPASAQYYVDHAREQPMRFTQNQIIMGYRPSPDPESREAEPENPLLRAPRLRLRTVADSLALPSSRHASPGTGNVPPTSVPVEAPASTEVAADSISAPDDTATTPPREATSLPTTEEPVAYPTPGSTENENIA